MQWELDNLDHWEHFLSGEPIGSRIKTVDAAMSKGKLQTQNPSMEEKHLDMPTSWSEKIKLPFESKRSLALGPRRLSQSFKLFYVTVWEQRYRNGSKTINYKKCRIELFSPYILPDGLIKRATIYEDYDYYEPIKAYEFYEYRADRLRKNEINLLEDHCIAKFKGGRDDSVIGIIINPVIFH